MYVIANLAIGGNWAGTPDSTIFPKQLEIDYIRIYERVLTDLSASIASPASGATVSGPLSVVVSASADVGVAKVVQVQQIKLLVDNKVYSTANCGSKTSSVQFYWDIRAIAKGRHSLSSQATDASGNVRLSSPVNVYVR
jgi:hypothetical protein